MAADTARSFVGRVCELGATAQEVIDALAWAHAAICSRELGQSGLDAGLQAVAVARLGETCVGREPAPDAVPPKEKPRGKTYADKKRAEHEALCAAFRRDV